MLTANTVTAAKLTSFQHISSNQCCCFLRSSAEFFRHNSSKVRLTPEMQAHTFHMGHLNKSYFWSRNTPNKLVFTLQILKKETTTQLRPLFGILSQILTLYFKTRRKSVLDIGLKCGLRWHFSHLNDEMMRYVGVRAATKPE